MNKVTKIAKSVITTIQGAEVAALVGTSETAERGIRILDRRLKHLSDRGIRSFWRGFMWGRDA